MTKNEFINKISKIINEENKKRGYSLYNSVIIAQACLESGFGSSQLMMKANAIFGIKANKNWRGKIYNAKTKECYEDYKYTEITACFRAYNSIDASVKDYFDLICKNSRYRKALYSESPKACITAIKNGGYATDTTYITKIINIIEIYNLYVYDNIDKIKYQVGNTYRLQVDLKVREKAGISERWKNRTELTENARKNSKLSTKAILKKGTKVTCLQIIKKSSSEIWIRIPSGFICAKMNNKYYIK